MSNLDMTIGKLFLEKTTNNNFEIAVGQIKQSTINTFDSKKYLEKVAQTYNTLSEIMNIFEEKVAILSNSRIEWHFLDVATIATGGIIVPIYPTYLPSEIEHILEHSESSLLIVENESQLDKVIEIQENLKKLKVIIIIDEVSIKKIEKLKDEIKTYSYSQLFEASKESSCAIQKFIDDISKVKKEQTASIVYTSGTTGNPKGAVLTHEAFYIMLENTKSRFSNDISNKDRSLVFLPMSHVLGRCDSLLHLALDHQVIFGESIETLIDDLPIVAPSILIAVPRIFEKIYSKIKGTIEHGPFIRKKIFNFADQISRKYFEELQYSKKSGVMTSILRKVAYKVIFSKIYNRFGGKIRFFVSGGAPISPDITTFMKNANLVILEGYGLTETIAPCVVNPTSMQVIGSVGLPLGDVKVKIASDGEVLIKSKAIFKEYYKDIESTQEAFTNDGWFQTGDIGLIDSNGYLKLTDRKKDIIITSGGKNIAPQKIENIAKKFNEISHIMIIGNQKKYLTAIIAIEKENFNDHINKWELSSDINIKALTESNEFQSLINSIISNINNSLARFETIKKFYIADFEFSVNNDMLTPSLKLKKKNVEKKFQKQIDAMYNS